MKVFVEMVAYNEEHIIEAAIRSVYDYVDKIIVVDGSKEGPSTDRTAEAAQDVGKKVRLVSGTFIASDGSWGERKQRQRCIDMMPKGKDNWCMLHDADEVFDDPQIQRLIEHLENAKPENMLFSYGWIHFWRDLQHIVTGGDWSAPRPVGTFRLIPEAQQLSYNEVGTPKPNYKNWICASSPLKVILDDVFFYHYGHVLPFERAEFKVKHFVEQGLCDHFGYRPDEWERYRKEQFIPDWNKGFDVDGCKPYDGTHPIEVKPVFEKLNSFWKKKH